LNETGCEHGTASPPVNATVGTMRIMTKTIGVGCLMLLMASCQVTPAPPPTPAPATASVSREKAVQIADEASRKAMRIPIEVQPVVEETAYAFVITYPMTLSKKQMRAPDYYTRVTVDKRTGKITDFKVGS
jgi:hypothetical protein